ncbi:MAG TPA: hypothetical protein ACFE0H_00200 [Elainellaceae cyanobacterium]|jgi:hypothetical protein
MRIRSLNKLFNQKGVGLSRVLSLAVSLYYGLITLHHGLSHDYIVQDDARQHVVWLQQFVEPHLFPDDWIANYFQTVAPWGYQSVYWMVAQFGIDPLKMAKILPIILAAIATVYVFQVTYLILPVPLSGLIATTIFNQHLWLNDDVVSATPRAFVYPLFAAFLYYLLRNSLAPCLMAIALQGLFFPQMMVLEVAILTVRLVRWNGGSPSLSRSKADYVLWGASMAIALMIVLMFVANTSEFGSAITADQMQTMPEYNVGGRNEYFGVSPFNFIFNGSSGIRIPVFPSIIWAGFGLPVVLASRLSLAHSVTKHVEVLGQVLIASVGMFLLAHLMLLRLHFPSRYTYHSWRFVLAIAAGLVLSILLDAGYRWWQNKCQSHQRLSRRDIFCLALSGLIILTVTIVPAVPVLVFKFQGWIVGNYPAIYHYLATQPTHTLVASLAPEGNNIPVFAKRSTLVGREFALPHHPRYYTVIRERAIALVNAQYSRDPSTIQQFVDEYGVDFFLIDTTAFTSDYLLSQDWLVHSSFQSVVFDAVHRLERGYIPVLAHLSHECAAVSSGQLVLVDATCVSRSAR